MPMPKITILKNFHPNTIFISLLENTLFKKINKSDKKDIYY